MKTNAIVRIVLYTIAILALSGILLAALGVREFSVHFEMGEEREIMLAQEVDPSQIRSIEIDWAAGNIQIQPSETANVIQISESEVAEKDKMLCKISGSTLHIQFCKNSIKLHGFGTNTLSKDLVITVPADWLCSSLDIDAGAADVTIRDMTIQNLDFDGASGRCDLEDCSVTNIEMDAASGNVTFSGSLETLDFDGASADCKLVLTNCPRQISMDGASGNLDITLPSNCGFTAETGGLSFDFTTDFQTTTRNGAHIHGDGSCRIEIEALSGRVNIRDGGYSCSCGH